MENEKVQTTSPIHFLSPNWAAILEFSFDDVTFDGCVLEDFVFLVTHGHALLSIGKVNSFFQVHSISKFTAEHRPLLRLSNPGWFLIRRGVAELAVLVGKSLSFRMRSRKTPERSMLASKRFSTRSSFKPADQVGFLRTASLIGKLRLIISVVFFLNFQSGKLKVIIDFTLNKLTVPSQLF